MKLQSPELVTNLYRDLQERRLLPLIGVLLAGMVVVPIALSNSPESSTPKAPAPSVVVPSNASVPATEVVLSDPGLREYRRRLKGRTPKDPFAAQLQRSPGFVGSDASVPGASGLGAGSLTGTSASEPVGLTAEGREAAANAVPEGSSTGTGTESFGSAPVGGSTAPETTSDGDSKVVFYRLKVRSGEVGGKMKTQEGIGPSSSLPSKSVPALAFLGATLDSNLRAKRAFFLISNGVSSISGDGQCTLGDPCQMLGLKAGQYVDVVWTDGRSYRVKLLDFERHVRDTPPAQPGGSGN